MNRRLLEQVLRTLDRGKFVSYFNDNNPVVTEYYDVAGTNTEWYKMFASCKDKDERQTVVCWFLSENNYTKNYYNRFIVNSGSKAIEIITRIFGELGFSETENPFIVFIYLVNNRITTELTKENWIMLNDLYADYITDEKDLNGSGSDKDLHIIFNSYLYQTKKGFDIVKIYENLSDISKVRNADINSLFSRGGIPNSLKSIQADGVNSNNFKLIRDLIIYNYFDVTNYQLGQLRDYDYIKSLYMAITNSSKEDAVYSSNNANRVLRDVRNLNSGDRLKVISDLVKNGLVDTSDVEKLIGK